MKKYIVHVFLLLSILFILISCSCEHEWKNATCTTPVTCSKCGETAGDPLNHNWQEATCTTPVTCSKCGETTGDPLNHNWQEATCVTPKTCLSCGKTENAVGGHTWQDATCTTPKTCYACGETEGTVLHVWSKATCIVLKTCSVCNTTEGEYAPHSWQEATCTTPKTCSVCEKTEGDIVHKWSKATCDKPKTCTLCGTIEGDALGHTNDEVCARCGTINKNTIIENAKNSIHIYGIDLDVNSVGGVDTYITWKNLSHKEIKYIVFSVQYYNRVKDILKDEIDGSTTVRLQQTGPIPYGKGCYDVFSRTSATAKCKYFVVDRDTYEIDKENGWVDTYWKAPFYNTSTKYIKLSKIEIEYMDGTYYTISDPEAIAAVVGTGEHIHRVLANDTGDDYLR